MQTSWGTARTSPCHCWTATRPACLSSPTFRPRNAKLTDAVTTQVLIHCLTIVLASVVGWLLAGRVLRPLNTLADTAQVISDTDLTAGSRYAATMRRPASPPALNDMLGRLESAFATQRNFLDEVSHELRAPLTVIRGHVELLDLEEDPDERRRAHCSLRTRSTG